MKYLWRGAFQPFCRKLGFVLRSHHPCLNMSARLAKLLRLISEMLPRSCTALARHETTPIPPPPHLPSFLARLALSLPPTLLWLGLSSPIYCLPLVLFISRSIPVLTEDILPFWKSSETRLRWRRECWCLKEMGESGDCHYARH